MQPLRMPSSSSMTRILPLVSMVTLVSRNNVGCRRRTMPPIRRTNRQGNGECGAAADLALHVDLAVVHLDDPIDDRQPEACPLPGGLGGEERSEQLAQVFRWDAGAGV